MNLDKIVAKFKDEFEAQATKEYPREACGVVILRKGRYKYIPCRNIAGENDFKCHPEDISKAEDEGTIVACFHTHTNGNKFFTEADRMGCEGSQVPYILLVWPLGLYQTMEPCGYHPGLLEREYIGGVLDCYTLVQDYFKEKFNIDIPYFERCDRWWAEGFDLLTPEHFEQAGFYVIPKEDIQEHDVVIMQNGSKVADHAAIYIGNQEILHHCYKRLSCTDVYGGMWMRNTRYVLRNKQLCSQQSNLVDG